MALLNSELSVWDIGFRWAGLDPDRPWLRLPLAVKDNFRLLMGAIHSGEILCGTLTLAKRPSDSKANPQFYIRTHLDALRACVHGHSYNRKLLRWAEVNRYDFHQWCEAMSIPLPSFWFPPGWKMRFEAPEGGTHAMWARHVEPSDEGFVHIRYETPPGMDNETETGEISSPRQNQKIKICCQQVASEIWKEKPEMTIADAVRDDMIQKYAGGGYFQDETVRGWIKEVAPPEVRSRKGRPRKK